MVSIIITLDALLESDLLGTAAGFRASLHLCLLFIHPPAHGSEVSPAARNTLDSARIPRASKPLIYGLFLHGRVSWLRTPYFHSITQAGRNGCALEARCATAEFSHRRVSATFKQRLRKRRVTPLEFKAFEAAALADFRT